MGWKGCITFAGRLRTKGIASSTGSLGVEFHAAYRGDLVAAFSVGGVFFSIFFWHFLPILHLFYNIIACISGLSCSLNVWARYTILALLATGHS